MCEQRRPECRLTHIPTSGTTRFALIKASFILPRLAAYAAKSNKNRPKTVLRPHFVGYLDGSARCINETFYKCSHRTRLHREHRIYTRHHPDRNESLFRDDGELWHNNETSMLLFVNEEPDRGSVH